MPAPKNNVAENKDQVSLVPLDLIIPMLEPAYREGIIKYKRESWREGFNSTVMYDAMMRHLKAFFFDLESYDPEAEEKYGIKKHHLGAAMFCLINLYHTDMSFPSLDDRPLKVFNESLKNKADNDNKPIDGMEDYLIGLAEFIDAYKAISEEVSK
jgi:hypothetical protein